MTSIRFHSLKYEKRKKLKFFFKVHLKGAETFVVLVTCIWSLKKKMIIW